jgi:hypothetical protein
VGAFLKCADNNYGKHEEDKKGGTFIGEKGEKRVNDMGEVQVQLYGLAGGGVP